MKKLLLVPLAFLLSSCALIDIYKMARWDNNEYFIVNEIQTQAVLAVGKCGTKDVLPYVNSVYAKSLEYKNYAGDISRNQESVKMSDELLNITKGLKDRYDSGDEVGQRFCELKFNTIQTSTGTIKRALGAKPR